VAFCTDITKPSVLDSTVGTTGFETKTNISTNKRYITTVSLWLMLSSQLRPDEVPTSEDKWNATTLQESGPRGPEIRIYRFIVYIKKAQRLITHFCWKKK